MLAPWLWVLLAPSAAFLGAPTTALWSRRPKPLSPGHARVTSPRELPARFAAAASAEGGDEVAAIHADADAIFSVVDMNGDDVITFDELTAHLLDCGYSEDAVGAIFAALDEDLSGTLSRDELRETCASVLESFKGLLEKALANAAVDKVDAVELVGGGSRVAVAQEVAKEVFGVEVFGAKLDDATLAHGAALCVKKRADADEALDKARKDLVAAKTRKSQVDADLADAKTKLEEERKAAPEAPPPPPEGEEKKEETPPPKAEDSVVQVRVNALGEKALQAAVAECAALSAVEEAQARDCWRCRLPPPLTARGSLTAHRSPAPHRAVPDEVCLDGALDHEQGRGAVRRARAGASRGWRRWSTHASCGRHLASGSDAAPSLPLRRTSWRNRTSNIGPTRG